EAIELGAQICQALETATEQGVVHRDLKSANVMVTARGRVKILDFGLATVCREADEPVASRAETRPLGLAGTVAYMAPEQLFGEEVDARSARFAAGGLRHEIPTGERPCTGPVHPADADGL